MTGLSAEGEHGRDRLMARMTESERVAKRLTERRQPTLSAV